ncbi:hypothetical protein HQ585_03205, partial [candidate division KSB1 bacterium]|nr:hypothetical protein [candidate division KSB1 bacterium]
MSKARLTFVALVCLLFLAGLASVHAQSGWTWIILETDVPVNNPGYVDVVLGVKADSETHTGRLGNFNIRGTQSSALYGIADTSSLVIAAIHPEHFEMTLTPSPFPSVWQLNAVFDGEVDTGPLVTSGGVPILTLRFFIRDTSGTSGIEFLPMSQTYTDNNMQSISVQFDDSGGDVGLWHIVDGVEVRHSHTGAIVLIWPDEPENRLGFHIWRASNKEGPYIKQTTGLITPSSGFGQYTDSNVQSDIIYWYKIEAVLDDETSIFIGPVASSTQDMKPDHFDLSLNYPNPFNESNQFTYQLPKASE